jgi:hypothetical protein
MVEPVVAQQPAPVQQPTAPQQPAAAQQPVAPPYQYAAQPQPLVIKVPGPFSKLFDLSFQGFVTRDSSRLLFTTTLVLLGAYWVFALIFGIVAAAKFQAVWCIGIFSSLVLVTVMIIWTRIMMELTMTVSEMRDQMDKTAQAAKEAEVKAASQATPEPAPAPKPAAKAPAKTAAKTTRTVTPKAGQ